MKNGTSSTKKLTIAAIGAAVSAVCVFLTNIVPIGVTLLLFATLCYYLVLCKCGLLYGLLDIAASLLLTFFTGGVSVLSSAFLLTAVVFAPYSLLAYGLRKLYYTKWRHALIRIAVMIVFANVTLVGVWFLGQWITNVNVGAMADKLGGYAVLAVVYTGVAVLSDFLCNQIGIKLLRLLP